MKDIKEYIGSMEQLCGIKSYVFDEGRAKGVKAFDVDNGAGLRFTLIPDRGMDIYNAVFDNKNVVHMTKAGIADARFYEPAGNGWLRTFGGGLLTTCGFGQIGDATEADGDRGQHGRLANTPAFDVCHSSEWEEGRYVMRISGKVRDAVFYGEDILLKRTVTAVYGEPCITITDEMTNEGCAEETLMLLYHMNLGYPLIRKGTRIEGDFVSVEPLNEAAANDAGSPDVYDAPALDGQALLYKRELAADENGMATLRLVNEDQRLYISYSKAELPCLTQWKNARSQDYVAGIEPGTGFPIGRAANIENGTYKVLAPGEKMTVRIIVGTY